MATVETSPLADLRARSGLLGAVLNPVALLLVAGAVALLVGSLRSATFAQLTVEGLGSGKGIKSASPNTGANRPIFQSALAASMRSFLDDTKFHQMWRIPSIGSPPSAMNRASPLARIIRRSPGRNTKR